MIPGDTWQCKVPLDETSSICKEAQTKIGGSLGNFCFEPYLWKLQLFQDEDLLEIYRSAQDEVCHGLPVQPVREADASGVQTQI